MTLYHVLRQQKDGSFIEVGTQEATGAETANRRQANEDNTGGVYLAVPQSSWTLSEYEPFTTTGLRKVGGTARAVQEPIPGQTSLDDTDREAVEALARSIET